MEKILFLLPSVFYYLQYCLSRFTASDMNIIFKSDGFSELDIAALNVFFSFSYSLFQIPIGFAQDNLSQKVVSSILIFLSLLGSLLFFVSKNFYVLCIGKFLTGIGASMAAVGLWSFLLKNMPQHFLLVSSLSTALGLLLPIYVPIIIGKKSVERICIFQFFFGCFVLFLMLKWGDKNKKQDFIDKIDQENKETNELTEPKQYIQKTNFNFLKTVGISSILSLIYFIILQINNFERHTIVIQCFFVFIIGMIFTTIIFNKNSKIIQDLKEDFKEIKKPIPLLLILNVCLIVCGFYTASEGKIDFYLKSGYINNSLFLQNINIFISKFLSTGFGKIFGVFAIFYSILGFFLTKKIEYFFLLFCIILGPKILGLKPGADIVKLSYSYSGFLMPLIVRNLPGLYSVLVFSFINSLLPFMCYYFVPDNYFLLWIYCFLLGVICKMQVVTADNWKNLFPKKQNYNGIFSILNCLITTVGAGFFPWFTTFFMEKMYCKNAIDNIQYNKYYFLINSIWGLISFIAIVLVIVIINKNTKNKEIIN